MERQPETFEPPQHDSLPHPPQGVKVKVEVMQRVKARRRDLPGEKKMPEIGARKRATGVTRTLNVTENWSIESVQVKLSERTCTGNIGVELTSPAGTKSILININSGLLETSITNHVLLSNAFYGESSAGVWSLKLISGAANCTPTLVQWQLNVSGH